MDEAEWNDDIEDFEPVILVENDFINALESLNVSRIMECWSESDQAILIFPGIDVSRGIDAIRDSWEIVTRNTSQLKLLLTPISVMRSGDMGWTFLGGTLMSTHGDETLSIEVYVTNVYVREAGGWKIAHHHATPAPHQPSYLEQRLN